jgi:hypothetical protein
MQYATLEDTVYLGFAANLTSGAAGDGATPLFDVREGGAAANAAPVFSGTPTLLSHASYSDGLYEIAIAATALNGFAADKTYLVFATLIIDAVTPAAFVGSFRLAAVPSKLTATGLDAVPYTATGALALARAIWTDTLTAYTDGMAGKRLKGISAVPTVNGTINDAAATTLSFITSLTGYGTEFFADAICLIEYAADKWQANIVSAYDTATGRMTFTEAFYAAPANGLNIALQMTHVHPLAEIANAAFTTQVTESYRADGAAPTLAQAACEILAHLGEASILGTTKTIKKFDGTTAAETFTLNDATTPTSITRAT